MSYFLFTSSLAHHTSHTANPLLLSFLFLRNNKNFIRLILFFLSTLVRLTSHLSGPSHSSFSLFFSPPVHLTLKFWFFSPRGIFSSSHIAYSSPFTHNFPSFPPGDILGPSRVPYFPALASLRRPAIRNRADNEIRHNFSLGNTFSGPPLAANIPFPLYIENVRR